MIDDRCYSCQYYRRQSYPSIQGDGYGNSYEYCDPPMGECPLEVGPSAEETLERPAVDMLSSGESK